MLSAELYDTFARINKIDQAIFEAERECSETGKTIDAKDAFAELENKYF